MTRKLLFDIDDTLFPSSEFAESARRNAVRAMVEAGVDMDEEELFRMLMGLVEEKGSNYNLHFDDLCAKLETSRPAKYVAAAVRAYHATKEAIQPYPMVPRTLMALRDSGHEIYVATDGKAVKQWDKLLRMGIHLFFQDVFVSEELGVSKKEGPLFFKRALEMLSAHPEECVMIGDRPDADIAPAKEAGLWTIRVLRGPYSRKEWPPDEKLKAHAEIKSLPELPATLAKLK